MRRQMVGVFRDRLGEVIVRSQLSPAAFARSIGIDRSTLSQLLAPSNDRLPRADTLAVLAARYDVSIDWLLGLTGEQRRGVDVVEPFRIEGQAGSPIDERFLRWYAEAENGGYPVRTVPRSFPDFFKRDEIIRYEYADWPEIDVAATVRWAQDRLESMRQSSLAQEACVSLQGLRAFAHGQGQWDKLDPGHRRDQLRAMSAICRELFPSLRVNIYDLREIYSAPFTVFGPQRATLYAGGLFFVFTATEHVRVLNRRFDDLIRAAVVQPPDVSAVLTRMADEIEG